MATDLAARGIDAEHIDLVIHLDVPRDAATYLHRVGRAGRFGAAALTCTIACEGNELTDLRSIVTRTRASVRILTHSHLTLKEEKEDEGGEKGSTPALLTIQDLGCLWLALPELEGTGLEGQGNADSLLTDIEHDFQPGLHSDSSRALLPQGKNKKKKMRECKVERKLAQKDGEEVELEQAVNHLTIAPDEPDENVERRNAPTQQDWWNWYQSWLPYMRQNRALIEQQEYLRFMSDDIR